MSMAVVEKYREVANRAREEHEMLQACSRRLLQSLEEAEHAHHALAREAESFRSALLEHTRFEEEGGFMKPVAELRPTLSPKVEKLREEHRAHRKSLDDIVAALHGTGLGALESANAPAALRSLIEALTRHEEEENSLVLGVFCDDVGTKD